MMYPGEAKVVTQAWGGHNIVWYGDRVLWFYYTFETRNKAEEYLAFDPVI